MINDEHEIGIKKQKETGATDDFINKLYVVTLVNGDVVAGVKMDVIDELTFVRHPALLSSSGSLGPIETGMFLLSGDPVEIAIYNRAIIHYYTTTSEILLRRYKDAKDAGIQS